MICKPTLARPELNASLVKRAIVSGKVIIVSSIPSMTKRAWFVCIESLIDARCTDVIE
jgi:hypothetical protein